MVTGLTSSICTGSEVASEPLPLAEMGESGGRVGAGNFRCRPDATSCGCVQDGGGGGGGVIWNSGGGGGGGAAFWWGEVEEEGQGNKGGAAG